MNSFQLVEGTNLMEGLPESGTCPLTHVWESVELRVEFGGIMWGFGGIMWENAAWDGETDKK